MTSPRGGLEALVARLRRYAFAILGAREPADGCVARVLQATAAEPPDAGVDLVVRLFADLHRVLRAEPWPEFGDGSEPVGLGALDRSVHSLGILERHVLVLRGLERFDAAELGAIVGLAPDEAEARLAAAYAQLREGPRGRVLICEEDTRLAEELARAVHEAGHDVVGIAPSVRAATIAVVRSRAELILTELVGGDAMPSEPAIEAVRRLAELSSVIVVAGSEGAFARLAVLPVVVLMRPLDVHLLGVAVAQVLRTPMVSATEP